jgi:hypothetical protein
MPLVNPKIVGPLSVLTLSIRTQGQVPGATVSIYSNKPSKHLVAKGVATASDQRFNLVQGVALTAQDQLYAMQTLGNEASGEPSGDLLLGVQPIPQAAADLGFVAFKSHLYECGQFLWVTGAIPGATVYVLQNGQTIGSAVSFEGNARMSLSAALQKDVEVVARQVIPNLGAGPDTKKTPDKLPLALGKHLPPPILHPPVRGCDVSLHVTDAFDGARVTLQRSSGSTEWVGFDVSGGYWFVQKPFVEGEEIIIRQEVAFNCERKGDWSAPPLKVEPNQPVDPPTVKEPLCAGATVVTLTDLRPGALVHISADGQVITGMAPPEATTFDFIVPPLVGGTVTATQEMCKVVSAPSKAVNVDPHPSSILPAAVVPPLFACARFVDVKNVHAGATLQVRAKKGNVDKPISDLVTLYATQGSVAVTPYLHEGDDVYVMQWACSNKGVASGTQHVKPHPPVPAPLLLGPIIESTPFVEIDHTIPGALIELYVHHDSAGFKLVGSAVANNLGPTVIYPNVTLSNGDAIQAKQSLCGDSVDGEEVTVGPAFRVRPFYVIGHNPNTIAEVNTALKQGANGVEPDVNVFSSDQTKLCISHGEGGSDAPALADFLKDLHAVAVQNPQLALIVFDCKSPAAKPDFGLELLTAIRAHLTFDLPLSVIISVASFGDVAMFDKIYGLMGPREGLMIDEENSPVAVWDHFANHGVSHRNYGNGNHFTNPVTSPNLRPSIEHACGIRAGQGAFKFIYIWPINGLDYMHEAIRIGVDGMITDSIGTLKSVVTQVPEFQGVIRMATRADNPFNQPNAAYGLYIHTGDKKMAGTDAHLTFTLTGSKGTGSKTIDAERNGRMERNQWNYVTIPSPDLGDLTAITVERSNAGNAPDWFLDRIIVRSARYGVFKEANFNQWIDSTAKFTKLLV